MKLRVINVIAEIRGGRRGRGGKGRAQPSKAQILEPFGSEVRLQP